MTAVQHAEGICWPRVQIPGPRPICELSISESDGSQAVAGSQGGHRFSWNSVAAAPVQVIADRRLNSLTAIAQPIYQRARGPDREVIPVTSSGCLRRPGHR
jgi:hypothetical protein